jgi:hypothetical protein
LILGDTVGVGDGLAVASGDGTDVAAVAQAAPRNTSAATGRTINLESQALVPPWIVEPELKALDINKLIK